MELGQCCLRAGVSPLTPVRPLPQGGWREALAGGAWLRECPALPSQKRCLWWLGGLKSQGESLRHPFPFSCVGSGPRGAVCRAKAVHSHMLSCRTKLAMLLCLKYLGSTSLANWPWSSTWKLFPLCRETWGSPQPLHAGAAPQP